MLARILLRGAAAFVVSAGITVSAYAQDALERVQSDGIRIGFNNEAPFIFKQEDGSLAGADYDLLKLALERLGVTQFEGVLVNFGSLIPGIQARRFDMIAAGLYIRPKRCDQVLFSEPNLALSDTLVVRPGNPKNLHSFQDVIGNSDIKIGGGVGSGLTKNAQHAGVPEEQLVQFPDIVSNLAALKAGRIDGTMLITVTARWNAKNDPKIEVADPWAGYIENGKRKVDHAAFAFNTDDQDLRDAFNAELTKIIGTDAHLEILQRYGMTAQEFPAEGMTTAKLCQE